MLRVEVLTDGEWRQLAPDEFGVLSRTGVGPSLTWPNGGEVQEAWRAYDDDRLIASLPARAERL